MEKARVIIVIKGGNVDQLHSTVDLEYTVVDLDPESRDEPVLLGGINDPDSVTDDLKLSTLDDYPEVGNKAAEEGHKWA